MKALKGVIVGDARVGKTSRLVARTAKEISFQYNKNVFHNYSTVVLSGSSKFDLEVWDTSGQDGLLDPLSNFIHHGANVYIICFALDRPDSFHNVKNKWYPEVQHHAPGVPIILVGTRCDVRGQHSDRFKMVTPDMGEQLKNEINAFAFIECSAWKHTRLDDVFEEAVKSALLTSPRSAPCDERLCKAEVMRSWLECCDDVFLLDEAVQMGAQPRHLVSRVDTAKYLDSMQAIGATVYSPPSWAIEDTGTSMDSTKTYSIAYTTAYRFRASCDVLLSRVETYKFLDAKRAAGYEVNVPPSWATDAATLDIYNEALAKNASPRTLNSRADVELLLLNIDDLPVSCWPCGLFGWGMF